MEIVGDILEAMVSDFVSRSGRKPYGILMQDEAAVGAREFLRLDGLSRKPRKTNFDGIVMFASASFPYSLGALFVVNNGKMYGFLYHLTQTNKKGFAKVLNARNSFPALSLPMDMVKVPW